MICSVKRSIYSLTLPVRCEAARASRARKRWCQGKNLFDSAFFSSSPNPTGDHAIADGEFTK